MDTYLTSYTMDLGKRIVLLKASVKEGEYPTFTPEDMIFLFGMVTLPDSVILNHSDPTECYAVSSSGTARGNIQFK